MVALIEQIERDIGLIEVLVFNVGANVPSSILGETARKYYKIWEMACFAGFLNAREEARCMMFAGVAPSCSPTLPPACAAPLILQPLPAPSTRSRVIPGPLNSICGLHGALVNEGRLPGRSRVVGRQLDSPSDPVLAVQVALGSAESGTLGPSWDRKNPAACWPERPDKSVPAGPTWLRWWR